jgi:hypothetical protein
MNDMQHEICATMAVVFRSNFKPLAGGLSVANTAGNIVTKSRRPRELAFKLFAETRFKHAEADVPKPSSTRMILVLPSVEFAVGTSTPCPTTT